MTYYLAHLTQSEGCDYTIGCGIAILQLTSNNLKDAIKELTAIIEENYSGNENQIESAKIYEVTDSYSISPDSIYAKINAKREVEKKLKIEEKEREELERLKKKYEGENK